MNYERLGLKLMTSEKIGIGF